MSQEIFYWLIVLFIVATLWCAGRLVDYFLQKDNDREVQKAQEPGKTQPEGSPEASTSK
jgi:hypothetical protein